MQIAMLCGAAVLLVSSPAPGVWIEPVKIEQLLPGVNEISGWQQQGKPYTYLPANLYSYINGAADQFIAYGFIKLCGAEYVCLDNRKESITVDMYDMGADLGALGIFKSKKDPACVSAHIEAESCATDQYLLFHGKRFYVEIQAQRPGADTSAAMRQAALLVVKKCHGATTRSGHLNWLRSKSRIEGSENYLVGGILGHGFLPKGVVSDYLINKEKITAYIVFLKSRKDAGAAFEQYKKYLTGAGEKVVPLQGLPVPAIASREAHHKQILAAPVLGYMVCISELSSTEQGKPLLKEIIDNITDVIESARPYPMSTR